MRHVNEVNLLQRTKVILKHQKAEQKIKGEQFNIFSILKMETNENRTHSAFIGELLNPYGVHLNGAIYLKLFLEEIGNTNLDYRTTQVILEKPIGPRIIRKEKLKSTGGRIDIYLRDNNGQILSIENKINAPEQELQVVRYWNHKKSKNTVYYLTLDEKTPSSASTLKSGRDYYEINYGHHIINWLEKCQKESVNQPIIRESIKQYIILLKKLTGQMDSQHQKELNQIILTNYEAADSISKNLKQAREVICEEIHNAVIEALKIALEADTDLVVEKGNKVPNKHSQIWIRPIGLELPGRALNFLIESFSGDGHYNGQLLLGILNPPPHQSKYALVPDNTLHISKWLINQRKIPNLKEFEINLSHPKTIQELYNNKEFKAKFIKYIVKETKEYINQEYPKLKEFLQKEKLI